MIFAFPITGQLKPSDKKYNSFRFDHRDDFNPNTGRNQNDMFVRNDIVKKNNVVQL